jgi:hypothetical protein
MPGKPLTAEQTEFFDRLHFRVLKTKAEYHPNHLFSQGLLFHGYVRAQKYQGQLEIHAMRGRYGALAATVQEDASPAEIVKAIQATENEDIQWLLENDERFVTRLDWVQRDEALNGDPA